MKCLEFAKVVLAVVAVYLATVAGLHSQTFKTFDKFSGPDGAYPYLGSLVQGTDGNLYGTTASGGVGFGSPCPVFGCGTVFKVTPGGRLTTLYEFCSQANCADGGGPAAGLFLGTDGHFYGTTQGGGVYGAGTVFKITSSGVFTSLYSFCAENACSDGTNPRGTLTQASNGNFFGTTTLGGAYNSGTVFEITQGGKFSTLYSFCRAGYPCLDGNGPWAGLVQGTNGNLFGTTTYGGSTGEGTVFEITLSGKFKLLHSFCSAVDCADGKFPYAAMIQSTDGNFYGTTSQGGISSGTVFKITPGGTLTTLYDFGSCTNGGCPDGASPVAGLIEASDENFYGTTQIGGINGALCGSLGCGVVFKITSSGQITVLHDFCSQPECGDGFSPEAGLAQATNGTFYGMAMSGGSTADNCSPDGCGTVFGFSIGLTPFIEAVPNFGKAGRVIGILGNNLKDTTSVTFDGALAAFEVISDTYVKAEVPVGASTGLLQLTTSTTTLASREFFFVTP